MPLYDQMNTIFNVFVLEAKKQYDSLICGGQLFRFKCPCIQNAVLRQWLEHLCKLDNLFYLCRRRHTGVGCRSKMSECGLLHHNHNNTLSIQVPVRSIRTWRASNCQFKGRLQYKIMELRSGLKYAYSVSELITQDDMHLRSKRRASILQLNSRDSSDFFFQDLKVNFIVS